VVLRRPRKAEPRVLERDMDKGRLNGWSASGSALKPYLAFCMDQGVLASPANKLLALAFIGGNG